MARGKKSPPDLAKSGTSRKSASSDKPVVPSGDNEPELPEPLQPPEMMRSVVLAQNSVRQVSRSGPLPVGEDFDSYEKTFPGAANRILSMAEQGQKSHHTYRMVELCLQTNHHTRHNKPVRFGSSNLHGLYGYKDSGNQGVVLGSPGNNAFWRRRNNRHTGLASWEQRF